MGCFIPAPVGPGGEVRGTIPIVSPFDQPAISPRVFAREFSSPLLPGVTMITTQDMTARFPWGMVAVLAAGIAYLYLERKR